MNKQEFPKFIQNSPHGFDKFEGKSAERVADAIYGHICNFNENDKLPKIIGLDGEWGSGKSNIIKILDKKLGDSFILYEYDAWGHQEDLQRRSFLESLTTKLIEIDKKHKIFIKNATVKTKEGIEQEVSWDKKLKYLLAKKIETETTSYPKVGIGVAVSFFTAVLTPIFVFIAYSIKPKESSLISTLISIFISIIPILIALIIWVIYVFKYPGKYKKLDFFLSVYQNKLVEGIEFETISEDEPSVSEFKEWMKDLSGALSKRLIIVYDNMDRLPANKVKELWSSIHTFFSEDKYENIWVIIPFDRPHLANAFGENLNGGDSKLTCHFINKTFPVIYRVPPPVMTDWKKVFNEFYEEAFGDAENENIEKIQRIFGTIRTHFTPRDIIAFINELVSLKRTWKEEISLLYIAIFVLRKDEILNTPEISILSGEYLKSIEKIVVNGEETQRFISALTFGIDVKLAEQIPLKQYLQKTLKGEAGYDINRYTDHKHFISFLRNEINDIDISTLDKAILSLSKLDLTKGIVVTKQWNELAKLQMQQPIVKCSIEDTYKALLLNSDDVNQNDLMRYLCDNLREFKEFKGDLFYLTMRTLDTIIKEKKLNTATSKYISEKQVSPDVFIEYLSQAKENYKLYKLYCDNNLLNTYLVGLMPAKLPKMDLFEFLVSDEKYSFDVLKSRIETAIIGNEIDAENFCEIIKTYKLISKEKPLKQQFTSAQIQALLNSTTYKTSEAYYDLVAMGLTQSIDTAYIEELDEIVAKRIEYYNTYGALLLMSMNWGSDLLRKVVKKITLKSYGSSIMSIEKVLPLYEQIKSVIAVSDVEFINRLNDWNKYAEEKITVENIAVLIPDFKFYKYSSETKNKLTTHINKIAINKLNTITVAELNAERNIPTSYWLNCAALLIEGNSLANLPDNLTEFCKGFLLDIASGIQPIPTINGILDTIINKAHKNKLQPTIKSICDDFCNKIKTITPPLFIYFVSHFDFINKMTARDGDITRNILNVIITDAGCFKLILENSEVYIKKIKRAGIDAEDLKANIRQLILTANSEKLEEFANSIGIKDELSKSEIG